MNKITKNLYITATKVSIRENNNTTTLHVDEGEFYFQNQKYIIANGKIIGEMNDYKVVRD